MSQLAKYPSLLSNFAEMHQALDRLFEPSIFHRDNQIFNAPTSNWLPAIDIKETKDQYVIKADIPGMDPKNIEINIANGILCIKGHRESEVQEERENYMHIERSQGAFCRTMNLANVADASKISAKSKNGVLEIFVPKAKECISQKIKIKES